MKEQRRQDSNGPGQEEAEEDAEEARAFECWEYLQECHSVPRATTKTRPETKIEMLITEGIKVARKQRREEELRASE